MEKTINIIIPGSLSNLLTSTEKSSITKLKVMGNINAKDFRCMRDELPLLIDLDLSEATVKSYYGTGGTSYFVENYSYLDNEIPIHCFIRLNFPLSPEDNRRSEAAIIKIVLPNSITSIADSAFTNHSGLKEIIIPDSVKKIGIGAFEKCGGLEFLSIGSGIEELGNQSFMDCKNLKTILIKSIIPPKAYGYTFVGSYNNTATERIPLVYVPDQSIDSYNNTHGFEYYRSSYHPQTYQYVIGITGLTSYCGSVEYPSDPIITTTPTPSITQTNLLVNQNHEITINYGKNGRIEMNSKRLINNKTITIIPNTSFNIVPNKNYKIDTIRCNDIDVKSEVINNQYTPTLLTEKSVLNVTFKKKKISWNRDELINILLNLKIENNLDFDAETLIETYI